MHQYAPRTQTKSKTVQKYSNFKNQFTFSVMGAEIFLPTNIIVPIIREFDLVCAR